LGGDEQLQLACLEECKNMVKYKYKNSKKSIPKMHGFKLKKEMTTPIDTCESTENYQTIIAEIENEFNDSLLS
jgi:hypothetical protein